MKPGSIAVALLIMATVSVAAQSSSPVTFDVTSVKPAAPDSVRSIVKRMPGQLRALNAPVTHLIMWAYQVREFEIVGGPNWVRSDRYDIIGTYPNGTTSEAEIEMTQAALADRFRLKGHRETREGPLYNLQLARRDGQLGKNLRPSPGPCRPPDGRLLVGLRSAQSRSCGALQFSTASDMAVRVNNHTIAQLAAMLSDRMGRLVVDRTALGGEFDWELTWAVAFDVNLGRLDGTTALSTAVQDQLGLKLEASRGPTGVFVIDSIERPKPD